MKTTLKRNAGQRILQLRIIRGKGERVDVQYRPCLRDRLDRDSTELFWAGRNFAMRRSARVAA